MGILIDTVRQFDFVSRELDESTKAKVLELLEKRKPANDSEVEKLQSLVGAALPAGATKIGFTALTGDQALNADREYRLLGVLEFIADRLKVALKDKGIRHDLIDAVFSLGHADDLVPLVARVEALQAFLKTDDGVNLLAGYKRAANILKAEEKKDDTVFTSEVTESLLAEPAEKALFAALEKAKFAMIPALEKEDFAGAMGYMAALRAPVDGFFEGVKVNDDNPKMRQNRLSLLASFRAALHHVADFSRIEG